MTAAADGAISGTLGSQAATGNCRIGRREEPRPSSPKGKSHAARQLVPNHSVLLALAQALDARPTAPAPEGGPGTVWVNSGSKACHCPVGRFYGKTKRGEYMTVAAAKAAGAHHGGKDCF